MAVDTKHPEYRLYEDDWQRIRDTIAGQRAMQNISRNYLRRPPGADDEIEWKRYVDATPFFGATGRTVEGLSGLAFSVPAVIQLPAGMKAFVDDATQDGVPFAQFTEASFEELVSVNRVGLMLDFPPRDPTVRNRRDEERTNRRPFARRYVAESIINWAEAKVNGVIQLVEVRLGEIEWQKHPTEPFVRQWRRVIRVLELIGSDLEGWKYQQRLFAHKDWHDENGEILNPVSDQQKAAAGTGATNEPANDWILVDTIPFVINGKPIDYIPFWIVNESDQTASVKKPHLLPLANLNIAHFNTTGQLENCLFWCGTVQPWMTGKDPKDAEPLKMGANTAWILKDANAKVGLLSLKSDDFSALPARLKDLEQQMAVMGAKMLAPDKKAVEAAETARIHRQGEISVLGRMCGSLGRALTDMANTACEWQGVDPGADTKVELSTSFFDAEISFDDATSAVGLWQKGFMAPSDVLILLKRGRIVGQDRTLDQISSENQSSPIQPVMPNLTDNTGSIGNDDKIGAVKPRPTGTLKAKPAPAKE